MSWFTNKEPEIITRLQEIKAELEASQLRLNHVLLTEMSGFSFDLEALLKI